MPKEIVTSYFDTATVKVEQVNATGRKGNEFVTEASTIGWKRFPQTVKLDFGETSYKLQHSRWLKTPDTTHEAGELQGAVYAQGSMTLTVFND